MLAIGIVQATDRTYYFESSATIWEETLPLGNGRIGMMPWGGVKHDLCLLLLIKEPDILSVVLKINTYKVEPSSLNFQ